MTLLNKSLENGEQLTAEIIDSLIQIPVVGSVIHITRGLISYNDYRYLKKLQKFLLESEEISQEKKDKFWHKLSKKDYKRISEYLQGLLYTLEEEAKAAIMGQIYKARLDEKIDDSDLLRLCYIVSRAFIDDLDHLKNYLDENSDQNYITDHLKSLGVLQDLGNVYEETKDGWASTSFGPTKHSLNDKGKLLLKIMDGSLWG